MDTTAPRFPIGTEFIKRGKYRRDLCAVEDILTTYNAAGEMVRRTYLCSHEFLGQRIRHEEGETTILRALEREQ